MFETINENEEESSVIISVCLFMCCCFFFPPDSNLETGALLVEYGHLIGEVVSELISRGEV